MNLACSMCSVHASCLQRQHKSTFLWSSMCHKRLIDLAQSLHLARCTVIAAITLNFAPGRARGVQTVDVIGARRVRSPLPPLPLLPLLGPSAGYGPTRAAPPCVPCTSRGVGGPFGQLGGQRRLALQGPQRAEGERSAKQPSGSAPRGARLCWPAGLWVAGAGI